MAQTIEEYLANTEVDSHESNQCVRRLIDQLFRHLLPECDRRLPQYKTCPKTLNYASFVFNHNTARVSCNVFVERERGSPFDSIQISDYFKLDGEVRDVLKKPYDEFNKQSQTGLFNHIVRATFAVHVEDLCPDMS